MPPLMRRLILLILTLSMGLLIGLSGQWLTGDDTWFLALPATVAIAWFWVADTRQCSHPSCLTTHSPRPNEKPAAGSPPTTGS